MEANPKVKCFNVNNGSEREFRNNVWKNMRKDKDPNTRGGGWKEISSEDTARSMESFKKMIAEKAIPTVEKKSAVDVTSPKPSDDPNDLGVVPDPTIPVVEPIIVAEHIAPVVEPVALKAEKPKATRKRSPKKKK